MVRHFRFAVQSFNAESPQAWRERARRVEQLGYSTLHLADHYLGPGPMLETTNHPLQEFASVPLMTAAAEATSTLKIGSRVMCIDYRPLAVLVKEAATIHWLSGGRMELGLGAGWLANEYEAMGIPMDSPGVRVSRLEEYTTATKLLLSGEQVDFAGDHVSLAGFAGSPVPETPIPIMIGGGSRRVLGIAGREADTASLNYDNSSGKIGPAGVQSSTAARIAEKVQWVRDGAESAGRPMPELEIGGNFVVVTSGAAETSAAAKQIGDRFGLDESEVLEHPNGLIGTVERIVDLLVERRERYGISYVTVPDRSMDTFAPVVERLAGG